MCTAPICRHNVNELSAVSYWLAVFSLYSSFSDWPISRPNLGLHSRPDSIFTEENAALSSGVLQGRGQRADRLGSKYKKANQLELELIQVTYKLVI